MARAGLTGVGATMFVRRNEVYVGGSEAPGAL